MPYTKEELLAVLLYLFKTADDIDVYVISEILSRKGFVLDESGPEIYDKDFGICDHIKISERKDSPFPNNHLYTSPVESPRNGEQINESFFFLGELVDIEILNVLKNLKKHPREWLLRRLIDDPSRDSLTNGCLKGEINRSKSCKYIKISKIKLTEKGQKKLTNEGLRNSLQNIIEFFNNSEKKDIDYQKIIQYLENGTVMGSEFEVTNLGKAYIDYAVEEDSYPEYLDHGAKEYPNE